MRTVTLDISKFGLIVGDTIKLQLINSVGGICASKSGYTLDATIVLDSTTFEIELLESEYIDMISFYQITLPNTLKFNFTVPSSFENTPHDLLSLLQLACYKGIINIEENKLEESFVEKLDLFFTGENPHFTNTQKDVVNLYIYYADKVIDTTSTIDIMQMMDEYLATLIGE